MVQLGDKVSGHGGRHGAGQEQGLQPGPGSSGQLSSFPCGAPLLERSSAQVGLPMGPVAAVGCICSPSNPHFCGPQAREWSDYLRTHPAAAKPTHVLFRPAQVFPAHPDAPRPPSWSAHPFCVPIHPACDARGTGDRVMGEWSPCWGAGGLKSPTRRMDEVFKLVPTFKAGDQK